DMAYGDSCAVWRISFAQARPIPAIARWSRRSECRRRFSAPRISPSRSAPSPTASGPRCASSASASSGVSSQTPARFFAPASVSRVHAVAVQGGKIVARAGDVALSTSLRSAAKPIQAQPLARARADLDDADLAIASASHFGTELHVEAVRTLLRKTGGSEDELECGLQDGRPPERIYHNCSGKHAGMIAVCRERGWPVPGNRLPDHPLQQELLQE